MSIKELMQSIVSIWIGIFLYELMSYQDYSNAVQSSYFATIGGVFVWCRTNTIYWKPLNKKDAK